MQLQVFVQLWFIYTSELLQVERVQAELMKKRDDFRKRMEGCAERQVALQKDQQQVSIEN